MVKTVAQASLAVNEKLKIQKNSIKNGKGKKRLSIVTGIHGDELEGQYFAYLLGSFLQENIESLDGTVDIYPALNPLGIDSITRGIPLFDLDMNRIFPGSKDGAMPEVIASAVIEDLTGSDVCIDVHASNIFLKEIPQIRININIADGLFSKIQGYGYGIHLASFYQPGNFLPHVKLMETGFTDKSMMKLFGTRFGIVRNPRPYDTTTLNYNWQIWETKAFSLYANSTDSIDEKSALAAVEAVLRFMSGTGIITKKIHAGYDTEIISEANTEQIHSEAAGIFRSRTEIGETVSENEVLAEIVNPLDGETVSEIRTHVAGIVYFEYSSPLINENSVCFKIIKD